MKKKPKEEQLSLFTFVNDTMIIQDQLDLMGIDEEEQLFYNKMKDVKPLLKEEIKNESNIEF